MLNKKASKQTSLWKYGIVLPVLTAFMLQFQVNVVAQEKAAAQLSKVNSTTISVNVDPNATDDELKSVKEFAATYNVTIEFSGIQRDKKGNLTYLIAIAKNSAGKSQKYATASTDGDSIGPFRFFVKNPDEKDMSFGFESVDGPHKKGKTITTVTEEVTPAEKTEPSTLKTDKNDGINSNSSANDKEVALGYFKTTQSGDALTAILENKEIDAKKALIKINGKESSYEEMMQLNPEDISTNGVTSFKGADAETQAKITKAFGEKAVFGMIDIELKGFKTKSTPEESKASAESFKLDYNEGGFIIHKKSGKEDFKFYKKQLAKIDLKLEISKLERNSNNEITAIKVQLTDTKNGTGGMAFWNTTANKTGIPDINIGRRNGKVLVSSSAQ